MADQEQRVAGGVQEPGGAPEANHSCPGRPWDWSSTPSVGL